MDDRWRDTYDAWKTRVPDDDGPVCNECGSFLVRVYGKYGVTLLCERCDEETKDRE